MPDPSSSAPDVRPHARACARRATTATDVRADDRPPEGGRSTARSSSPDINKQIASHVSWSRTPDRRARTKPARDKFLERFEREVDPDGKLPVAERRRRAEHAKRAYMLRLAKRSALVRQTDQSDRRG